MICEFPLISEHFQAFIVIHKLQHAEVQTLQTGTDRKKGRLYKEVFGVAQNKGSYFW